ncbi:MAG: OmpA family protein [Proteobacteria bacterium]|nr:OmpA family protein [Pseudomonadota bacterium]
MARKKRREEPDDHNRWIVSYADFITLLFALFAVMYAMSSLNLEKYAAMSASLTTAFSKLPQSLKTASSAIKANPSDFKAFPNPDELALENWEPFDSTELWWATPLSSHAPIKPKMEMIGDPARKVGSSEPAEAIPSPEAIELLKESAKKEMADQEIKRVTEEMTRIANDIKAVLGPVIQLGNVTVTQSEQSVSIVINASILFDPGKAKLNADSTRTLSAIARVLATGTNRVRVEGYTDNLLINNSLFPSNWELSAHRAATVAHLFTKNGIADDRLTAVGRSQNDPTESNDTPEGRAHNRRVIVSILPSKDGN